MEKEMKETEKCIERGWSDVAKKVIKVTEV